MEHRCWKQSNIEEVLLFFCSPIRSKCIKEVRNYIVTMIVDWRGHIANGCSVVEGLVGSK